uniref:Putative ovule protein n=1 Tax=Solanum chacoense TaxID=4108 RepID=A0A0V0GIQ8_SOLCH
MIFSNSKEFKWAVEVQAVLQKKDIKFKKNESTRSRATCKVSNCKRFIFASKANQDEPYKIKTIGRDHSCGN